MSELKPCNEPCIANIDGKCAVRQCKGNIVCLDLRNDLDPVLAAQFYEISKKAFDDYFGRAGDVK